MPLTSVIMTTLLEPCEKNRQTTWHLIRQE